jgi:hypothetical protein
MKETTRDSLAGRWEYRRGNPETIAETQAGRDARRTPPLSCELFRSAGLAGDARPAGGGSGPAPGAQLGERSAAEAISPRFRLRG